MSGIGKRVSSAGYIAGWKIVGALPECLTRPLAAAGADWVSNDGAGMDMLRRNLTRVVGAENVTKELVRDSMRSYARYWLEAFQLPRIADDPNLDERLTAGLVGREYLQESIDAGNGVVLTLPHSGNWDMAGMWLAKHYGTFTTVAERLRPEKLFDSFVEYRESLGFEVLALTGEKTPPYARLKEVLQGGGIVCLMGERDLGRRGVPVTFFGEDTTFPVGPAKLALETGASLHTVHTWFAGSQTDPRWGMSVAPALKVTTLERTVQAIADEFAVAIAHHPQDWHMLQPLWPVDVPVRGRRWALDNRSDISRET